MKREARSYAHAVKHAFLQQWRQMLEPKLFLSPVIGGLETAVVVGYIAGRSDHPAAATYLLAGAALAVIWNNAIFRTGWSLAEEHSAGTLDLMMTTRTPLALIMLGKTLAFIALAAIAGAVTFFLVLVISRQSPALDDAALLISAVVALIAVVVSSFFFAPFAFLAGVRGGFFNAIMPFGVVVSGFLYPVGLLPGSLEAVARLLPTAWAMQAVADSLDGASGATVALDLVLALGLSALLLAASCLLFLKVEQRARISGNLSAF